MISLIGSAVPLPVKAIAMAITCWALSTSAALAHDDEPAVVGQKVKKSVVDHHARRGSGLGTLGYGPPGLYPGFPGFGLGYHLGYGYGGDALGPGADGGYPFYGGPGYPHCDPRLWRCGGINPFPYHGGPGYPIPDHPNYFGGFGPLVVEQPVITISDGQGYRYDADVFGPYTGAVADPEALFSPATARVASGSLPTRQPTPTSR